MPANRRRDSSDPIGVVPTDSTECTAPSCSAHVQLGDVPQTHDPVELKGVFRQHDGDDEVTIAGLRLSTTTI